MSDAVCSAVSYNPTSGQFTWLEGRYIGQGAGTHNKQLGYIQIRYKGVSHYAHRLAWKMVHGVWPDYVDHINGNKTDNRIANLRSVSKQENHRNMKCFSSSSTGIAGVARHNQLNKWRAYITVNKKQRGLGCFEHLDDAIAARKVAEQVHGFHANHGRSQ